MILAYARVSTVDQDLDGQRDALEKAGAGRLFADAITGTARHRPELDRLPRSLKDLLEIVGAIESKGAGFRCLAEDIDTTTPAGRLMFHVFASIAEFERARVGGRLPALLPSQRAEARRMRDEEGRPMGEIAALFRVSAKTTDRRDRSRLSRAG